MKLFKSKREKKTKTRNRAKMFETFTKLWVSVLLIVAVIDLQLSYTLAFLGKDQIAETLSVAIVTELLGVVGIYMVKSFLETKEEKKHELEELLINSTNEDEFVDDSVQELDESVHNEFTAEDEEEIH